MDRPERLKKMEESMMISSVPDIVLLSSNGSAIDCGYEDALEPLTDRGTAPRKDVRIPHSR